MDRPALRRGITSLQRTAGNRAVGRLLARSGLLDIPSDPNDPHEYEDLESYLAGITVLSEEGALELWDEHVARRRGPVRYSDIELKPAGRDFGPAGPGVRLGG